MQQSNTTSCCLSGIKLDPQLPGTHPLSCGFCTSQVNHEDFNEGIIQVQAKKKANLSYYA